MKKIWNLLALLVVVAGASVAQADMVTTDVIASDDARMYIRIPYYQSNVYEALNFGAGSDVNLTYITDTYQSQYLMKFNLSSLPEDDISAAALKFSFKASTDTTGITFDIYLADSDAWVEGTGLQAGTNPGSNTSWATWNTMGNHYTGSPLATISNFSTANHIETVSTAALLAAIQNEAEGDGVISLLFKVTSGSGVFYAKERPNVEGLTIDPTLSITTVPEPASLALILAGGVAALIRRRK